MLRIHSRRTRGLTVVELVIAMLLSLVVVMAAWGLHLGVDRSFRAGARKVLAQQESTLLSTVISRRVRVASSYRVYQLPDRETPTESGNGLALLDRAGNPLGRLEWSDSLQTVIDGVPSRVTSMKVQGLIFRRDSTNPRAVRYAFQVDDEKGDLVDIESAASLRN